MAIPKRHQWRQKSKHQQICTICGQVKRWDGFRWLYRKQGQLVRERPACKGERTDSDRYADYCEMQEPDDSLCPRCGQVMYSTPICDGSGVLPARKAR